MATVTATITLTATNLTTDSLSTTVLNTVTGVKTGGIHIKRFIETTAGDAQELAEEDSWAGTCYVYLRNADATGIISVLIGSTSTAYMILAPGEWAWFPWRADDGDDIDIFQNIAEDDSGTLLEYGLFGA